MFNNTEKNIQLILAVSSVEINYIRKVVTVTATAKITVTIHVELTLSIIQCLTTLKTIINLYSVFNNTNSVFNDTEKHNQLIFAVSSVESDDIRISIGNDGNSFSNTNRNSPRCVNSFDDTKIICLPEMISIITSGSYELPEIAEIIITYGNVIVQS